MELIGLLLAFTSLPPALFFAAAKLTGNIFFKIAMKLISIITIVLSIIYILKYFNLL